MHRNTLTLLISALTLTLTAAAGAQQITWSTIDGGGTMQSAGGQYALSGTIGQHDAGSPAAPMIGGGYALVGGFWAGAEGTPPCPCELDGNMIVNVFDLLTFLNDWFPANAAADYDGNAQVDVFDLLAFLECWFPASAGQPCG